MIVDGEARYNVHMADIRTRLTGGEPVHARVAHATCWQQNGTG